MTTQSVSYDRVLCFSTLLDYSRHDVTIFRSPIYSFNEELKWPPSDWQKMHCWHCCQRLENPPVPLPNDQDAESGKFLCYGLFCSFNCAKAYLFDRQSWSCGDKLLLLEEMASQVFGITDEIYPAPPQQRLAMFGGDLSVEEFRKQNKFLNVAFSPPLISFPEVYERESIVDKTDREWSVRGIRPKTSSNEKLKFKEENISNVKSTSTSNVNSSPFSNFCNGKIKGGSACKTIQATNTREDVVPGTLSVFMKKK